MLVYDSPPEVERKSRKTDRSRRSNENGNENLNAFFSDFFSQVVLRDCLMNRQGRTIAARPALVARGVPWQMAKYA